VLPSPQKSQETLLAGEGEKSFRIAFQPRQRGGCGKITNTGCCSQGRDAAGSGRSTEQAGTANVQPVQEARQKSGIKAVAGTGRIHNRAGRGDEGKFDVLAGCWT